MALVVFTGGARSGKSTAAVDIVSSLGPEADVVVVVFGQATVDEEFAARIALHRRQRPARWATLEATDAESWMAKVPQAATVLLDCLGTCVGLAMDEAYRADDATSAGHDEPAASQAYHDAVTKRVDRVVEWLLAREGDTVVVTNEVGDGVVPAFVSGRLFRDVLGRANRRLVERADSAYLCVAGRLIELSALPRRAVWPSD